ncbi:hypothetical protein kac65v162_gp185 [Nodularia phage vB_NspS-kac65v162]|jgi:hypothetical protein|uniref:Uncharacterized protein n=3 Tax=Ravarandavirus kac65v151 TaxID=2845689 RepID=A0A482MK40_9CAUD|nr:hypothetical protein HWC12_gp132 [Nodularia phage vB_NspS-kac65v151]QBQ73215.1 hypothetical protein kac65v151_gp185 [Nodularia phage vB_NspS-kac65v151]QBQ73423.1 hypothetical protein kac65v161_gp185 [Nodularia phage vB_NspS-kac65v161]QBQ73629.1 hypothetical protein kac65v162_gp185 [Nodularia phage vB_NspS-kac65v162]
MTTEEINQALESKEVECAVMESSVAKQLQPGDTIFYGFHNRYPLKETTVLNVVRGVVKTADGIGFSTKRHDCISTKLYKTGKIWYGELQSEYYCAYLPSEIEEAIAQSE